MASEKTNVFLVKWFLNFGKCWDHEIKFKMTDQTSDSSKLFDSSKLSSSKIYQI